MAKAFRRAAHNEAELGEDGDAGNPIIALIVAAAVAYTDALTARFAQRVNQQDHAAATKGLRAALRERLPKAQETRLARILSQKEDAQYNPRILRMGDAIKLLGDLEKFATWAESELEG